MISHPRSSAFGLSRGALSMAATPPAMDLFGITG
jgi:hypothetical protein